MYWSLSFADIAVGRFVNGLGVGVVDFLAFVRSGFVGLYYGQTRAVGEISYNWSRTAGSINNAYYLGITFDNVNPSGNDIRRDSIPLRCLYPGSA